MTKTSAAADPRPGVSLRISPPVLELSNDILDRLARGMAMIRGVAFVYFARVASPDRGAPDHAFFVVISPSHEGHTRNISEQAGIVVRQAMPANRQFPAVLVPWNPALIKPIMKVGTCVVLKKRHDLSAAARTMIA